MRFNWMSSRFLSLQLEEPSMFEALGKSLDSIALSALVRLELGVPLDSGATKHLKRKPEQQATDGLTELAL
jgi:hypothetical protein